MTNKRSKDWKKYKLLEILGGTSEDINKIETLFIKAVSKVILTFYNKQLTFKSKAAVLAKYFESIFLQNPEKWTLIPTLSEKINSFKGDY